MPAVQHDEQVRIGIAVREERIALALRGTFLLKRVGEEDQPLPPGEWEVSLLEPGVTHLWGARIQTFTLPQRAEKLKSMLAEHGVESEVFALGREAHWGDAGTLQTSAYAVVVGSEETAEQVIQVARRRFAELPLLPEDSMLPGWKRYDDEIPRLEPIRLTAPGGGALRLSSSDGEQSFDSLGAFRLVPASDDALFELAAVRIGIDFHWDHRESLAFRGELELVPDGERITAVNELPLDIYLASVLGSEMRGDWPVEALAAQAVAARSTVLATRGRHHYGEAFDLCHDDHCQCYQGASRESETARRALERVRGLLLAHDGRVADARYAKSCGGLSDHYHVAWDDEEIPYLAPVPCGPLDGVPGAPPDPEKVPGVKVLDRFLDTAPEWAACNPETVPYPPSCKSMEDLYRWSEEISQEKLQRLVEQRCGRKLGLIRGMEPLEFGASGRIRYLKVVGERGSVTVGKELAIRRLLSDTHLPSSAFHIVPLDHNGFRLEGIGWGHGVGLCQLGAATLASRGWTAGRLLRHYYPGAGIVSRDQGTAPLE